ncbi:HU family DNA-binding protein [Azospirillum sp. Sh1]|uniref:HU family DNA-binding protein n=1 Tax=Azospirillum sp. Sh1 TaxID=2607285 RepID=UPI00165E0D52|nr:HU family DNA-binding protein [Azospirillum sp. Sh1]
MSSSTVSQEQEQTGTSTERPVVQTREIIEDIHKATGIERGEIGKVLTALYDACASRLANGEEIDLRGFMKMTIRDYQSRKYYVPPKEDYIERGPSTRVNIALAGAFKKKL